MTQTIPVFDGHNDFLLRPLRDPDNRESIWLKGETSGNVQQIVEIRTDCDQDAIVMKVKVDGADASCHTGRVSCFYRVVKPGKDGNHCLEFETRERVFDPATVYEK